MKIKYDMWLYEDQEGFPASVYTKRRWLIFRAKPKGYREAFHVGTVRIDLPSTYDAPALVSRMELR